MKALLGAGVPLKAMAHITGGGLPENLPRALPAHLHAVIDPASWERPELFRWLQEQGSIPEEDLWNTFNLGVGFVLVVPPAALDGALAVCASIGQPAWPLGVVADGPAGSCPVGGLPY